MVAYYVVHVCWLGKQSLGSLGTRYRGSFRQTDGSAVLRHWESFFLYVCPLCFLTFGDRPFLFVVAAAAKVKA